MSETTEERLRRLERAAATGDLEAHHELRRLRRSLGHAWEERIAAIRSTFADARVAAAEFDPDEPEDAEWLASSLEHATEALRLAELRDLPQLERALDEALLAVAPNDGILGGEGEHLWDDFVMELEWAVDEEQRRLDPSISRREAAEAEARAAMDARRERSAPADPDLEALEVAWRLRVVLILALASVAVGAWAALQ